MPEKGQSGAGRCVGVYSGGPEVGAMVEGRFNYNSYRRTRDFSLDAFVGRISQTSVLHLSKPVSLT